MVIGKGEDNITAALMEVRAFTGKNKQMPSLPVLFLATASILALIGYPPAVRLFTYVRELFKVKPTGNKVDKEAQIDQLFKAIAAAGFAYDLQQDIFYSRLDAWQRSKGYCRLYDELAAPFGMIIDCEPIYFEYEGKKWLIEFWKGQYDLTSGCEIGVYTTKGPDLNIPGVFNGTFYNGADDEDLLEISCSLEKNNKTLFTRTDKHWWLTGFKLGEFAEPSELKMNLSITLKDETMRDVFVTGLEKAGYFRSEIDIRGNTVSLIFDHPRTRQPSTRTPETDRLIQIKNKLLCDKYQEITGPYDNFPDKMRAVQEQAADMFKRILDIGKTKRLFEMYEVMKDYF